MRTFGRLASATLVAGLVLGFATDSNASRRSGLHGSLLLEDVTDAYAFPQLLRGYSNILRIHMGGSADQGSGLLGLGDEDMTFGVSVHRGDNIAPLSALSLGAEQVPVALLGGANAFPLLGQFPTPATVVDLIFATSVGDSGSFGARLGFANAGTGATAPGVDVGASQSSLNLVLGYSVASEALRLDTDLVLGVGLGSDDTAGGGDEVSGNDINVGLNGRLYLPMGEQIDLGVIGGLQLGFGGVTTTTGGVDASSGASDFAIFAGAGPVWRLDAARIGAYGMLAFGTASADPDTDVDGDETDTMDIMLPGVHLAAEVDVTEWLHLRSGAQYTWYISSTSAGDDSAGETGGAASGFGWSAGVGLTSGGFDFDVALRNSWLTSGPNFLGAGGPFAASAAATYRWGGAIAPVIVDTDGDGVADDVDQCPTVAEDRDGFEDADGCPDADNDKDGIPDASDKCPNVAEDFDDFEDADGCADTDNDADGIADGDDNCPLDPANECGVIVNDCEIVITQKVYFESGKDVIKPESYRLLDAVASVFNSRKWIELVEVQGHTDSDGSEADNLDLSERRAKAVVSYMRGKRVAAGRLTPKGYGESMPVASNGSRAGKAKNRRVQFIILRPKRSCD